MNPKICRNHLEFRILIKPWSIRRDNPRSSEKVPNPESLCAVVFCRPCQQTQQLLVITLCVPSVHPSYTRAHGVACIRGQRRVAPRLRRRFGASSGKLRLRGSHRRAVRGVSIYSEPRDAKKRKSCVARVGWGVGRRRALWERRDYCNPNILGKE